MNFREYIHYGKDLEAAIIGACLLEKMAFGRTHGIIEPENFYVQDAQKTYLALSEMFETGLPINLFTVSAYMTEKGIELNFGSIESHLTNTMRYVVSSAHIEYHCFLVKEMWKRREILRIRNSSPKDEGLDTQSDIHDLTEQINRIVGGQVKRDWVSMDELMYNLLVHQSDMHKGKKNFLTTGFKKLDQLNGGFYEGQMIVIGARPSVGKSALMGQMALSMAKKGKKVGIISLEMNNTEIAARLASLETDIDFSRVYRDIMKDEDLHRRFYDIVSKNTIHLPIYLSDKTKVDATAIKAKAAKLKSSYGCDCIMIDYLQLVDTHQSNRNYNREQEVAKISRSLKLMAQEMEIPVIVLCQLNRAVTSRSYKDRFPKLSDLRESGAIEQDADVVMFLHRDWMSGYEMDQDNRSTEREADLLAPKWRNGQTCHLKLGFDPPKMRFIEESNTFSYHQPQEIKDFTQSKKEDDVF